MERRRDEETKYKSILEDHFSDIFIVVLPMSQAQPPMGGKKLLLDKNSKLSAQVASQRKEINDLRVKLSKIEETEMKWQDTAACISSIWDELNRSIGFLQFKYVFLCVLRLWPCINGDLPLAFAELKMMKNVCPQKVWRQALWQQWNKPIHFLRIC